MHKPRPASNPTAPFRYPRSPLSLSLLRQPETNPAHLDASRTEPLTPVPPPPTPPHPQVSAVSLLFAHMLAADWPRLKTAGFAVSFTTNRCPPPLPNTLIIPLAPAPLAPQVSAVSLLFASAHMLAADWKRLKTGGFLQVQPPRSLTITTLSMDRQERHLAAQPASSQ
jgi:hypothetical protein